MEFSLSTLGPVGGFDSKIFSRIFAKYYGASGGGLAAMFSVEFSLSTLGPVGAVGSEFFSEIFAKYFGASEGVWQRIFRWNFREVLWGQKGEGVQRNFRWNFR